jgi:hypothetical protein
MGWGAICRDHAGTLLFAYNESIPGITSPELVEAIAARKALSIMKDKGF